MPIKEYDSVNQQWVDHYSDITRDTVGRIYVNDSWKIAWKPPYKKLSYLQGNGTSYIDTGLYGDLNSEIELVLEVESLNGEGIFGSRKDSTTNTQLVISTYHYPTVQPLYGLIPLFADMYRYEDSRASVDLNATNLRKFKVFISESLREIRDGNDNIIASNTNKLTNSFTTPTTLKLFKADGISWGTSTGKIYSYKHKKNGILLQNMIPVERIADNKKGMFDLVEGKFYFSANNTPFS